MVFYGKERLTVPEMDMDDLSVAVSDDRGLAVSSRVSLSLGSICAYGGPIG